VLNQVSNVKEYGSKTIKIQLNKERDSIVSEGDMTSDKKYKRSDILLYEGDMIFRVSKGDIASYQKFHPRASEGKKTTNCLD